MVSLRSLVAVLVAVLTLFAGAFRSQPVSREQVAIADVADAVDDAEQGTIDRGRSLLQGRTTKASASNARDGFDAAGDATGAPDRAHSGAESTIAAAPVIEEPHRRVRMHVEHMVFLM